MAIDGFIVKRCLTEKLKDQIKRFQETPQLKRKTKENFLKKRRMKYLKRWTSAGRKEKLMVAFINVTNVYSKEEIF